MIETYLQLEKEYFASEEGKAIAKPNILKGLPGDETFLMNRLRMAFAAGWFAAKGSAVPRPARRGVAPAKRPPALPIA